MGRITGRGDTAARLKFLVVTPSLSLGWAWWLFAGKSGTASLIGGIFLGGITVWLGVMVTRRSRRLRSDNEHVTARLEYHSGLSQGRWWCNKPARGDDGGSEPTMSGW